MCRQIRHRLFSPYKLFLLGLVLSFAAHFPEAHSFSPEYEALQAKHLVLLNRDPEREQLSAWKELAQSFDRYGRKKRERSAKALLDAGKIYTDLFLKTAERSFFQKAQGSLIFLVDKISSDSLVDDALLKRAELFLLDSKAGKAHELYQRIAKEYPESDSAVEARRILNRGKQELASESSAEKAKSEDFLIAIDAGHGGDDFGAVVDKGRLYEKDLNLKFARMLLDELKGIDGVEGRLVRGRDEFLTLSDRVQRASDFGASLFLSLHSNSSTRSSSRGIELYLYGERNEAGEETTRRMERFSGEQESSEDDLSVILGDLYSEEREQKSRFLADSFIKELSKLRRKFRGLKISAVRSADFYVLKHSPIPALVLESLYISNERDRELLLNKDFQKSYVSALAKSLLAYSLSKESHS